MAGPEPLPLIPPPEWLGAYDRGADGYRGNEGASPALQRLSAIANAVNPMGGTINCGNIIDAVVARLNGSDDAVAPTGQDGSFPQIEQRFNTTISWGQGFQAAFDAVQNGGPGTMAIVGIGYSNNGGSHVVVLANVDGTVGIVEGQDWSDDQPREVATTVDRANERYNSDGGSNVGFGIVGSGAPTP